MAHDLTVDILNKVYGSYSGSPAHETHEIDNMITRWLKSKASEIELGMRKDCVPFLENILGLEPEDLDQKVLRLCVEAKREKKEAPMEWCSHYRYDNNCASDYLREYFIGDDVKYSASRNDFRFTACPICLKPRPVKTERKELWEILRYRWIFSNEQCPNSSNWKAVAEAAKACFAEVVNGMEVLYRYAANTDHVSKSDLLKLIEVL